MNKKNFKKSNARVGKENGTTNGIENKQKKETKINKKARSLTSF